MGAVLYDVSLLQHHDLVGIPYRGEAVGDDEGGASGHQTVHAVLHKLFCAGVNGAGGLVQDQHRRIRNGGSRNAQELPLTLGQVGTVTGQLGVIALRQAADEAVRIGQLCRCIYLFICGLQTAVTDVFHDRTGEEVRILQHDAERTPQIRLVDLLHIDAVIAELAVGNLIKTIDEVRNGGLSGTGGAHQSDLLTGLCMNGNVMEHGLVLRVPEIHIFKDHIALQRLVIGLSGILMIMLPGPAAGSFAAFCQRPVLILCIYQHDIAVVSLGLCIQETEDTLCAGQRHDYVVELHADLIDGHGEVLVEGEEAGQGAYGEAHALIQGQETADKGTEHIAGIAELRVDGSQNIGKGVCLPGTLVERLIQAVKVLNGGLLVTEDLHHLFAAHGFLNKTVQGTEIPLLQHEVFAGNRAGHTGEEEHQRHHHQCHQCQNGTQHQHHGQNTENGDGRVEHLGQRLADHLPQGVNVVGIDGHDVAVGMGIKEADGQCLHVVEEILSQVHHAALGDLRHQPGLQINGGDADRIAAGHPQNGMGQRREIRLGSGQQRRDIVVDEGFGEHGSLHTGQYGCDNAAHHQQEPQTVIFHHIGEKPQEKLSRILHLGTGASCASAGTAHDP